MNDSFRGPEHAADEGVTEMDRLYRSDTDQIIGGVCGGLGAYLRVDPLIVRLAFVVLAMIHGIGLVAYILLWLFVPTMHSEAKDQEEIWRQNVAEMKEQLHSLGPQIHKAANSQQPSQRMMIIGAILVGVGLSVLLDNLHLLWWFSLSKLWPLLLIALGSAILLNNLKDKR
jgi:phage shock protein PspC (stress-responsive transcriptional regulator)